MQIKHYGGPNIYYSGRSSLPPEFIKSGNVVKFIFKTNQNKEQNSGFLPEYFGESKMFWTYSTLVWYVHFTFDWLRSKRFARVYYGSP